jgi:hypothetical protein
MFPNLVYCYKFRCMARMSKWFIPNLSELVKNEEKFNQLDEGIRNKIVEFLAINKIIAERNRFVKKANKEIREANSLIKKLKKNVVKIYPVIKNLPSGYSLSDLYVEKDRSSYRMDFHWIGLRKKCSLGTDLKKIEKICRVYNSDKTLKLTPTNFIEGIRQSLNDVLNDFLIESGYETIKNCKRIVYIKDGFKVIENKGLDVLKKDKLSQSKKLGKNANTSTSIKKQNRINNTTVPFPNLDYSLNR